MTDVLEKFDGRIDHETIGEMKYLEACINEDLRIAGPVIITRRLCGKDCEVNAGVRSTTQHFWRGCYLKYLLFFSICSTNYVFYTRSFLAW